MYLYNGIIVTMNKNKDIFDRGWVKIDDNGLIEEIGKGDKKFEKGINLNGDILLPGFVNGHTHIAMNLLRGYADDLPLKIWLENHIWPAENKFMDKDAVILGTQLGIMEALRSGTTTFCDMYFFTKDLYPLVEKIGIRGLLSEGVIDFPTPNLKNPQDAIDYVKDIIDNWDGEFARVILSVHAPYSTSPNIIEEVANIAFSHKKLFVSHVSETEWEVNEIKNRYGKTPVQHFASILPEKLNMAMAHSVHLTDEDMEIAAERHFAAVHCPQSNLKLSSGIAKIEKMKNKGMIIGIGTDGAASNNNLDMIEEMRTAALIGKLENPEHVSAQYTLEMATIEGAKALGIENETGSIEKGKWADIIRISLDGIESYPYYNNPYSHIIYALNSRDVKMTMVKGNILYEDGRFITIEEENIKKEVRYWQDTLIKNI